MGPDRVRAAWHSGGIGVLEFIEGTEDKVKAIK